MKERDGQEERRTAGAEIRNGYISLILRVLCLAIAIWLILTQFLLITQAGDNTMFPTIRAGDLIIAYRLHGSYAKNDVVVYEADGSLKIGRVAAKEGDVVSLGDSGSLLVNNAVQTGDILYPTYAKDGVEYPYTVPEGCVFVLSDYRTNGDDSRDCGAIPLDDVKGKVITILRRRSI